MRKERMKKAKEKREETKQRTKQKSLDKAARWLNMEQQQIIYLGEGVSAGLQNTENNLGQLNKFNLPVFNSVTELADNMKITLNLLRYLSFQRKVSKINHYITFEIPKKSGGKRIISAPKRNLKALQRWILDNILNQISVDSFVHGFIKERSIVTNANPHLGKDIVLNIDLKDFFPSIDYKRVKGLFHKLGYSEQNATIFALICTNSDINTIDIDRVTYYVQKGNRFLPQGSPASPSISNLIAYKLDKKLEGLAKKYKFIYSRYADDLTFSTSKENGENLSKLIFYIKKVVESEGFVVHPEKTHVMRKGNQQRVTGIVVNEKANIERTKLRKFRALLHNIEINGWKNQKWGKAVHLINAIEGYINFVSMVNSGKGKKFKYQLKKILEKHPYIANEAINSNQNNKVEVLSGISKITTKNNSEKNIQVDKENEENLSNNEWWNIFS